MKRILFASIIGLVFSSCQKSIDVSSDANASSKNGTVSNTNAGVVSTVTAETLSKGLLAYYTFSGDAKDMSGNGNDGAVHGAVLVADRSGNANSAYAFADANNSASVNNYISVDNLHANNVSSYSVSGWFNKSAASNNNSGTIFTGDQAVTGNGDFKFAISSTNVAQWNAKTNNSNLSVGVTNQKATNYSDGVWHSFCVTYTASTSALNPSNFQIYIDGVLVQTDPLYTSILIQDGASVSTTDLPIILGNAQGAHSNAFPGAIDDVRVFNRVLCQAEVTYLANEK